MISVAEARARILSAFSPLPAETLGLGNALGRVLAEPVLARLTQPPAAVSAMDGYAVIAEDVTTLPARLKVVGEVAAGSNHPATLERGQAVRIFTGAPLPEGADSIVIQEDTATEGQDVIIRDAGARGHYVRPAGLDFELGQLGIPAGKRLTVRDIGLAAAMNHPWLRVHRRPRIAILATGDEVVMPGEPLAANQIVSSNGLALEAFVTACGAVPLNLGIARDTEESLTTMAAGARGADLLITTGGVSVGKHDLVQSALSAGGLTVEFWKIAMRPGKPLVFGRLGDTPLLGMPGNPVSTLVCSTLFLRPAIAAMLGQEAQAEELEPAVLGKTLPANDQRRDYLRARLERDTEGRMLVQPFSRQDSAMLFFLAQADCLIVRPPHAPPTQAGELVEILRFDSGGGDI